MDTQPGMIISKDEGRAEKDMVRRAREAGVIDIVTAVEMQWDITQRTVPQS